MTILEKWNLRGFTIVEGFVQVILTSHGRDLRRVFSLRKSRWTLSIFGQTIYSLVVLSFVSDVTCTNTGCERSVSLHSVKTKLTIGMSGSFYLPDPSSPVSFLSSSYLNLDFDTSEFHETGLLDLFRSRPLSSSPVPIKVIQYLPFYRLSLLYLCLVVVSSYFHSLGDSIQNRFIKVRTCNLKL